MMIGPAPMMRMLWMSVRFGMSIPALVRRQQRRDTGQVLITSQNHGFAVDAASLPGNVRVTHVSLFDGSLQGMAWTDRPVFCFQGHPEASPGPHDVGYLFDRFVALMERKNASQ